MPARRMTTAILLALEVMTAWGVVHAPASAHAQAETRPSVRVRPSALPTSGVGETGLPTPVAEMREALAEAVRRGTPEDVAAAAELSELKPSIGDAGATDIAAALRRLSAAGDGQDVIAALSRLLDAPWRTEPLGRDLENNRIYVWEIPPQSNDAGPASASVPAPGWRLAIGADGTWHALAPVPQ